MLINFGVDSAYTTVGLETIVDEMTAPDVTATWLI